MAEKINMAKNQKRWIYSPKKPSSPKVSEIIKGDVETKANELIESYIKPTFIKLPPEDNRFNYIWEKGRLSKVQPEIGNSGHDGVNILI